MSKPTKPAKSTNPQQRSKLRPTMGQSEPKPIIQKLNNLVKSIDMRQLLLKNIAFIIMGVVMWQISPRIGFIPFPSWATGILAGAGMKLMVYIKGKNAKKWRKDMEYGSARFGKPADIKPFIDPDPKNNVILTKTECARKGSYIATYSCSRDY